MSLDQLARKTGAGGMETLKLFVEAKYLDYGTVECVLPGTVVQEIV